MCGRSLPKKAKDKSTLEADKWKPRHIKEMQPTCIPSLLLLAIAHSCSSNSCISELHFQKRTAITHFQFYCLILVLVLCPVKLSSSSDIGDCWAFASCGCRKKAHHLHHTCPKSNTFSVQQMILAASAIDNMDLADDLRISSNSCVFPSSLHPYRLLRSRVRSRGANPDLG
jgi:hypothetical protein